MFCYGFAMTAALPPTETVPADLAGFDSWDNTRILNRLLAGQFDAIDAVRTALPALSQAADVVADRLKAGGRLIYAGAGASIRIAVQDGSELPATFGFAEDRIGYVIAGGPVAMFETMANAEDDADDGARQADGCTSADVMIAVAASGATPFTVAAARRAREIGCGVVAVVNNPASALAALADIEVLLASGPEVIAGSTRMGAGTAQKAALNLLSTLVFTRLGAVHDGLMVNVQAKGNQKLRRRSIGIVARIAGVDPRTAALALFDTDGDVKAATLICAGAKGPAEASDILSASGENLRLALSRVRSQ